MVETSRFRCRAERWATAIAVAALCLSTGCRRSQDASRRTGAPLAVPEIARASAAGRPVIFLGLDGADWELLDRYMAAGTMPNLASIVAEGTSGKLQTIDPPLSPIVWTTMMTGMSALDHGILDFVQFDPVSGVKEPITSSQRRVPAIWNLANYGGRSAAAFGMWATFPAETVNGVMVSDRLFTFLYKEQAPPQGIVYPPDRETWAREGLARAQSEVNYAAVHEYLPWLSEAAYQAVADSNDPYAQPVSALRRMLIETRVYGNLSLDWIRQNRPDLTVVYLQSTDTVGHVFAPYAPPRQPSIPQVEYDKYSGVPQRLFHDLDTTIGAYRDAARSLGAVLMIASDHGFRWGEGRPTQLSSVATASAARWHAPDGIYALWGPDIAARPGHEPKGSVQKVCATLLALLGLPAGRDVEGDPLPGANPVKAARVDYVAHYHPASAAPAKTGAPVDPEAIANLKALGYIGQTESSSAPASARGSTRTPGSYNNEGLILRSRNRMTQAMEAFETALKLDPNLASAAWNLSDMLYARGQDLDRSDDLLLRAFKGGLPDGVKAVVGRAMAYQRVGEAPRSLKLMSAAVDAKPGDPELWLFRGRYRVDAGDCAGASTDFNRAIALAPQNPAAYSALGVARMCAGDNAGARTAFARSLQLDPAQPRVREYLQQKP